MSQSQTSTDHDPLDDDNDNNDVNRGVEDDNIQKHENDGDVMQGNDTDENHHHHDDQQQEEEQPTHQNENHNKDTTTSNNNKKKKIGDDWDYSEYVEPRDPNKMGAFQKFYMDDNAVPPSKKIQYLLVVARTVIPNMMDLQDHFPFKEALQRNVITKTTIRIIKDLAVNECKRRNIRVKDVNNKKTDYLMDLLRRNPLHDARDLLFIKHRFVLYCKVLEGKLQSTESSSVEPPLPTIARTNTKTKVSNNALIDRLRYILAFAEDDAISQAFTEGQYSKPKTDSNNNNSKKNHQQQNAVDVVDFHELICQKFNDDNWMPVTECLPDLHETFARPIICFKRSINDMTRDKSKSLLATQIFRLQPMIMKFRKFKADSNTKEQRQANRNVVQIDGDDRRHFLEDGCPSLLYWWHVVVLRKIDFFSSNNTNSTRNNDKNGGAGGSNVAESRTDPFTTTLFSSSRKRARKEVDDSQLSSTIMDNFQMKMAEAAVMVGNSLHEQNMVSVNCQKYNLKKEMDELQKEKFQVMREMLSVENEAMKTLYQQRVEALDAAILWNQKEITAIETKTGNA